MMILRRILLKLRRRSRLHRDMEAELAFHRDLAREQNNPIGLGNVTLIQEEARDLWRFSLLEDFCRDVVFAIRSLRRAPGFTAIAILTLALGIGANAAIFTLLHRVMLAPLPVQDPDRLVELLVDRGGPSPGTAFSYHSLRDLRNNTRVCCTIIAFSDITFHAVLEGKLANLLFGRALTRQKEIALRLSLGARRSRLIRQLLTECGVLVAGGGALGLLAAYVISKHLASFLADANALVLDVSPDLVTLGFTAAIAIFTVVLFGVLPAFRSIDVDFATRLKGDVPAWINSSGHRWSRGLIVIQVALLTVLVLGAGLFIRTLHNLNSITLGFDRSNVLLVGLDPFGSGHSPEQLKALSHQLLERIESLPGVRAATMTRFPPISGGTGTNLDFVIHSEGGGQMTAREVWVNNVGAKYFTTMGVPVVAGREFDLHDSNRPQRVVVVNRAFARRYFRDVSPVGKTITQRETPMEIIGVVGNAKYSELRGEMEETVYFNLFQQWGVPMQFLIRTERDPSTVAAAVREEMRSTIGNVLIRTRTLEDHIDASIVRERLVSRLAGLFGGLAFLLAVIGLYGVVSNSVARRTREIGIRIALGFERRGAVSMVLREVLVLAGGGLVLGLPLAMALGDLVSDLLYGLTPTDPWNVVAAVGVLLGAAVAAGFIPAWRAARVDPMVALRGE
jgi:predicted permease